MRLVRDIHEFDALLLPSVDPEGLVYAVFAVAGIVIALAILGRTRGA